MSDNVAVLIDSERVSPQAPLSKEREAFIGACEGLGIRTHVTERRAFENYLTEEAIQAIKGPRYRALTAFETFADVALAWGKGENWRIARAMTVNDLMATDVGQFLHAL